MPAAQNKENFHDRTEAWLPWRSHATISLWNSLQGA
jgi:3-methyladenine DNA glycosylase/8-oxoguanine DNA glycosylase